MMFMNVMNFSFVLLASLFSMAVASPVSLQSRDVFVPPILYPNANTVWKVGQHLNVTWDTTNHPVNITNKLGRIQLRVNDLTMDEVLASGFDILSGRQVIQVPHVTPGNGYQIVLFGDSGNFSPKFTITN